MFLPEIKLIVLRRRCNIDKKVCTKVHIFTLRVKRTKLHVRQGKSSDNPSLSCELLRICVCINNYTRAAMFGLAQGQAKHFLLLLLGD